MNNSLKKMILTAIAVILTATSIFAQSGDERRLAVLDFKAGAGVALADAEGISSMLISSLFDTHAFTLIERTQINAAIKEKGFQKDELTTQQIAQLGKILGVKKVIVGDVTNVFGSYNVDARIIDVVTGVIESSAGETVAAGQIRLAMNRLGCQLTKRMIASYVCESTNQVQTYSGRQTNSGPPVTSTSPCLDLKIDSKSRIYAELAKRDQLNYRKFRTGDLLNRAGTGLLVPGLILTGSGLVALIAGAATEAEDAVVAGGAMLGIGATFTVASIPLKIVGKNIRKRALQDYNKNCDNWRAGVELNLNLYGNGAGLAVGF